ncbi:DUF3817 domain-containing protein [Schlegelella sp. S2-27]|uniref:DUF3817 domain-containing protein n=1 Tax=Caldimonas mangrovi TaxID=2944811 RepID=A0ABT0YWQ2_9BURK|nr:DUF3817 domain-containing protein [Caldimonas mangrovi]MCM5682802.1 DUF3817 domain-containing protein [Caldimonas mangrovi]
MATAPSAHSNTPSLRLLRTASLAEGVTLLALLGVAVPLKHAAGLPAAVSLMGPVHGLAFLGYLWAVFATVSATAGWRRAEVVRLVAMALVPGGAFFNRHWLRRKEQALASAPGLST